MQNNQPEAAFPKWILEAAQSHEAQLNAISLTFLKQVEELYPHFNECYGNAAPCAALTVLSSYDLDLIRSSYPAADPRLLILRSAYEQFFFITGYQVRELAIPFAKAFGSGDFYVSAILMRSILEISSCAHYILRRLQTKFVELSKTGASLVASKSADHIAKMHKEFATKLYEAFSYLQRANTASAFPWAEHLQRFGIELSDPSFGKALNTKSCIEDIAAAYKQPFNVCYDVLSEFVHPNFGSKTLLIGTRERINEVTDRLKIGASNRDEKCLWFVDHLSEPLFHTIELALTFHQNGASLYNFICDLSENATNTYH
jgi:hypothetical protein